MKTWILRFASLKITVALLVLILVALAAGTIVESAQGSAAALHAVYGAAWFRLLLGLFALNVSCSLVDRWPWGWSRAGFALTHGSMLIILAGALLTDLFKTEGQIALWEREESSLFALPPEPGAASGARSASLPFSVRLEAFEIDTYPGTHRPAMFRSRVVVTDPENGLSFPAVIEMNRELSYRGYRLFQSSYQAGDGRDQTVLAVSRDPGQPIVFTGYALLLAGMITVLATRIAQRRAQIRDMTLAAHRRQRKPRRQIAAAAMGLMAAALAPARAAILPDAGTVEALRGLPVQHDGRAMPLDTVAREAVWNVTGGSGWKRIDPVALAIGWIYDPAGWSTEPIVRVGGDDLARAIGLAPGADHVSFQDLADNPRLMALTRQALAEEQAERPVQGLLGKARSLEARLALLQGFFDNETLRVVPNPKDPRGEWRTMAQATGPAGLLALRTTRPPGVYPTRAEMEREVLYNRLRPSRLAWWILLAATVVSIGAWVRPKRWADGLALGGLAAGFAVMSWGLATRWLIEGHIPASNMYESMLFLGWGVGLFALIAFIFVRNRLVILNATAMSAIAMILADCLPIDPYIHPMPPVLSGTPWLAIHVPVIMVSYSVLALGVLVAHMQVGCEIFAARRRDLAIRMNDLLYWYTHIGAILLIAGIMTGSIWAASSWGRYWGWDPKEVWSLIAFLAYLAILHGRFDRIVGPYGVAALSIIAFWTIVMTYVGVNFVLASGLRSYGFGSSSVVHWLLAIAGAEAVFLLSGLFVRTWTGRRPVFQILGIGPAGKGA